MKTINAQGGFTLIELLVGTAIFAVLMLAVQASLRNAADRVVVARTVAGFNTIAEAVYARAVPEAGEEVPANWRPGGPGELNDLLPRPLDGCLEDAAAANPDDFVNGQGNCYEVPGVVAVPDGVDPIQNADGIMGQDCAALYCIRTWLSTEELADLVAGQIGPAAFPLEELGGEVEDVGWPVMVGIGRPGTDAVNAQFVPNNCQANDDRPGCTIDRLTFNPNAVLTFGNNAEINFGEDGEINLNGGTINGGGGTLEDVDVAEIEALTVSGNLSFQTGGDQ